MQNAELEPMIVKCKAILCGVRSVGCG